MSKGESVSVKVYLNRPLFAEMAKLAEKSGKRRAGLLLFTKKPHGLAGETLANTDGLSKFFKFTAAYWRDHESDRLKEAADLAKQKEAIAKREAELGLGGETAWRTGKGIG